MRTFISISLSLVVLFQGVGLCVSDVFMLKDLVEHVEFHSEEYGDNFFTFFEKHYGSLRVEHQNQDSPEQHDSLPFQHSTSHQHLIEAFVYINEFHIHKTNFSHKEKQQLTYKNQYRFLESCSIFQPPKIA